MIKSFEDWMLEESPFKGNENNKDCKWASKFMQQAYEAGQQSKQAEIDKLKMSNHYLSVQVIDAEAYSEHWKYQRELDERITKALAMLEDEVIEVDYDEYRFVGNFVDADKLKEILK